MKKEREKGERKGERYKKADIRRDREMNMHNWDRSRYLALSRFMINIIIFIIISLWIKVLLHTAS